MIYAPVQPCDIKHLIRLIQGLALGGHALEIGHGISTGVLAGFFDSVDVIDINPPRMVLPDNVRYHQDGIYSFHNDRRYSFIFIDGDHRYSRVKDDILFALQHNAPGGVICGHDYDSQYHKEAHIEEDFVDGVHHGVTKAVNELFGVPLRSPEGCLWWYIAK